MTTCCTNGQIGSFRGERVFCDCDDGIQAWIDELSRQMGELAESMTALSATAKARALTPFESRTLALDGEMFERARADQGSAKKKLEERRG